uniref:Uncharacterized protein n=1 Tax=Anguilla anguilla TaxID=7936 RepID=A0A0E9Q9E8_ANGAN
MRKKHSSGSARPPVILGKDASEKFMSFVFTNTLCRHANQKESTHFCYKQKHFNFIQ